MISIIIPVYNVAPYICRCVESVLKQTYDDYEIILVDDGSTDRSGTICDDYSRRYHSVKVIHKSNGGLSSARNAGLDAMSGEYVMFVDGDDCIHPQTLQSMYSALEPNKDCIVKASFASGTETSMPEFASIVGNYQKCNPLEEVAVHGQLSCCGLLFHKSCFSALRFPDGRIFEDQFVIGKLLFHRELVKTDDKLYYYFQRHTGLSKIKIYPFENYDGIYSALELFQDIPDHASHYKQLLCKLVYNRVSSALGNAFFHDGQFQNCKTETISQIVREHLSDLKPHCSFGDYLCLYHVARGKGFLYQLCARSYMRPLQYFRNGFCRRVGFLNSYLRGEQ